MYKKNLINLLIILLITSCSRLYNNHISKSNDFIYSFQVVKRDFIAFPNKENEYKIYPLTKSFSASITKNRIEEDKKLLIGTAFDKFSTLDNVLRIGSNGNAVKYIQNRLIAYGYKLVADGLFQAATYDALLNFQYRSGLDIDGSVGSKTLDKLNISPDKNIEFNTKVASLSKSKNTASNISLNNYKSISKLESSINSLKVTSNTNYYINVDLPNQRVNIFMRSNKIWILEKSFICSSGRSSTPTVKGNFTVKDKGPMFRAGSNTICNYYTRFYGNYLFHTVLLDNNENIQDGRLGTPLSHGCIRLAIDDAKYIYTTIPYGTSVSIK